MGANRVAAYGKYGREICKLHLFLFALDYSLRAEFQALVLSLALVSIASPCCFGYSCRLSNSFAFS